MSSPRSRIGERLTITWGGNEPRRPEIVGERAFPVVERTREKRDVATAPRREIGRKAQRRLAPLARERAGGIHHVGQIEPGPFKVRKRVEERAVQVVEVSHRASELEKPPASDTHQVDQRRDSRSGAPVIPVAARAMGRCPRNLFPRRAGTLPRPQRNRDRPGGSPRARLTGRSRPTCARRAPVTVAAAARPATSERRPAKTPRPCSP